MGGILGRGPGASRGKAWTLGVILRASAGIGVQKNNFSKKNQTKKKNGGATRVAPGATRVPAAGSRALRVPDHASCGCAGVPNTKKGPTQKRKSLFLKGLFKIVFGVFRGAPGGRELARTWPRRPALEPRSIVHIRPNAARLVAKSAFEKNRASRKNTFSARCISAYAECRGCPPTCLWWHPWGNRRGRCSSGAVPSQRPSGRTNGIATEPPHHGRALQTTGPPRARMWAMLRENRAPRDGASICGHRGARGGKNMEQTGPANKKKKRRTGPGRGGPKTRAPEARAGRGRGPDGARLRTGARAEPLRRREDAEHRG